MISIEKKQILIDGVPQIIMCGEIHYFRLAVEVWEERILQLKEAGCNAVATYVPWIVHEEEEGVIDLDGSTSPELNLVYFMDLCKKHDLYFILRPGPFVMAEMKNDGIPFWVKERYPEVVATTWDGNAVTTVTLDYLSPNFIKVAKIWLKKVLEISLPRLQPNGGNIIAIQLDNEIGMLSWVSNCPDFSDIVLADLRQWLITKYGDALHTRYAFSFTDEVAFRAAITSPNETYSLELMKDLGYYMRYRFAKYVALLRSYCESLGAKEILYLVNIHGTSAGRGFLFPIGISQLYEAYQQQGDYVSGSDIYLDDMSTQTYQDLYIINGYMDAMHNEHQPLTSLEFACGSGDYGETFGGRQDISSVDLRARMCMGQGFKLLNYYLFAGGHNKRLKHLVHDGNDRIATTGERHGFAAPIDPEGNKNYTFERMAESIHTINANAFMLSTMQEVHDDLVLGFIPDYYMSEYHYPKSEKMKEVIQNIARHRAHSAWETAIKAILMNNYRFSACDLQNKPIPNKKVVIVTSAKYMDASIQQKIADYMYHGGNIFMYGELPQFDMEGNACTILMEALRITKVSQIFAEHDFHLSVYGVGMASHQPEIRTWNAQMFEGEGLEAILKVYGTDGISSFKQTYGQGTLIMMGQEYRVDKKLVGSMLRTLGIQPSLAHNYRHEGIFMTTSKNEQATYHHLLNLDTFDKTFDLFENGIKLFERPITLPAKRGLMLPFDMQVLEDVRIVKSTCELVARDEVSFTLRLNGADDYLVLNTNKTIQPSPFYDIVVIDRLTYIYSKTHGVITPTLQISFQ